MKSLLTLVALVADDQLVGGQIEDAEHRHLARLAGRFHPQIGSPLGPGAGEIGMGQSLGLVLEQEDDIPGCGLLLQQTQAQAGPPNRLSVLPPLQRVPWPAPCEPPFLRITTLSRDFEMRSPVRLSISSAKRGKVQFGRSDTPGANTSSTTDKAARALTGSGPHALRPRSPATPSRPKIQRQCRTLSGCTQNAAAIRSLVQPSRDSSIARARSASSRSDDPARPRNASRCSADASIQDRPAMFPPHPVALPSRFCHMWRHRQNLA